MATSSIDVAGMRTVVRGMETALDDLFAAKESRAGIGRPRGLPARQRLPRRTRDRAVVGVYADQWPVVDE